MKFLEITSRKKWLIIIVILVFVLLIYFILQFYVFRTDPVIRFILSGINSHLTLIENFSNFLFKFAGSEIKVENHSILLNNEQIFEIDSSVLMKKWGVFLLLLIWFTKTSIKQKILFTILLLGTNFIATTIRIILTGFLSLKYFNSDSSYHIASTIGVLAMIFICQIWVTKNKPSIINALSKIRLNSEFFISKIPHIFLVMYIVTLASNLIYGFFDFRLWIDLLFNASQRILHIVNIEATVESNYLIGKNGALFMARDCLGFNTLLLFASIVFLTGINNIRRWSYILVGVIFLNIINIIRFVLLFMHVQKYGDYRLSMDLHDMYTYIMYGTVFILWVIWFEFFTDIKQIFRRKTVNPEIE